MGGMEFNKLFAAVLVAGIVASLSGFLAKELTHPHHLEKDAIAVEGSEGGGGESGGAVKMPEPVMGLIAGADIAKGEKLSRACAACHSFDKGGADMTGPNLWGVIGRGKASHGSFAYSEGMKAAGGSWTYADLNHFLWKPKSVIADTKMNFIGLKKPEDRAAIIAWLRTKADGQAALPSANDIAAEEAALAPPAETPAAAPISTDTPAAP